jgi:tight adherence protein C
LSVWPYLITFAISSLFSLYLLRRRSAEIRRRIKELPPTRPIVYIDLILRQFIPLPLREKLDEKLEIAGNPWGLRAGSFLILQAASLVSVPIFYFLMSEPVSRIFPKLIFLILLFMNGFFLPYTWIIRRGRKRQENIEKTLPDFLDMLDILIGAGFSFSTAMDKILSYLPKGALREELSRVINEMRIGRSFEEALKGFSRRMRMPILSSFVGAVIQAHKLGVDISGVIRAQAESIRVHRRQRVEEAAAKAATKMIFPLMLCTLPLLFILLIGPVVIRALALMR